MNISILFLKEIWLKYKSEIILCICALFSLLISLSLFYFQKRTTARKSSYISTKKTIASIKPTKHIFIDIEGAIQNPDVYEIESDTRLKDVIRIAGGFTDDADRIYFNRHFNSSELLHDEEKIYIPSEDEIRTGVLSQNINTNQNLLSPSKESTGVNINIATIEELDTLESIGKVTAQKIFDNRPYVSTDDLVSKKVLSPNLFEKIKNKINVGDY